MGKNISKPETQIVLYVSRIGALCVRNTRMTNGRHYVICGHTWRVNYGKRIGS